MLSSAEQDYVEIATKKLSLIVEQQGTVDDDQIDQCVVTERLMVGSVVVHYLSLKAYVRFSLKNCFQMQDVHSKCV